MNLTNSSKKIIFLSTLVILIILCINNQKQYTQLKILIWKTPSLSLGNYIAISTGTGFLVSYLVTSNLSSGFKSKQNNKIKYKPEKRREDNYITQEQNNKNLYDNILIERDVNDPLPTINASFRVIGNTNKIENKFQNDDNNENCNSYISEKSDFHDDKKEIEYKKDKSINNFLNDWEEDVYSSW